MVRKRDVVCFFGESEVDSKKIYSVIDELILCGAERFLFPAHSFFCLDCAKQVLLRKKKQKGDFMKKLLMCFCSVLIALCGGCSEKKAKSEVKAYLREALKAGAISDAEYQAYVKKYAPVGYTY